jgi:hypothetical protein
MDRYTSTSGVAGTRMRPLLGRSRSKVTTSSTVTSSAATTVAARPRRSVDRCRDSCTASAPRATAAPATSTRSTAVGTRLASAYTLVDCASNISFSDST